MVFSVGLGIIPIGEQADDLEAIRRTAAYQDRRRQGPFSLFYLARRMGALHWRLFRRQGSDGCLPYFGFDRCDGHHEMVDVRLEKASPIDARCKKKAPNVPGL
jgi:hypothetical protein